MNLVRFLQNNTLGKMIQPYEKHKRILMHRQWILGGHKTVHDE